MIEFGAWQPDLPMVRTPHLRTASGCLPAVEGYQPFNSLSTTSNALDNTCLGATVARDIDQAAHMYAGDASKLYELEGTTWTDRSKTGGYGPAGDTTRWRWTTFGDRLIATNTQNALQYIDMSTAASQFADLAGSPGSCQFLTSFSEFVVQGAISGSVMSVKWSGFGDSTEWTPGTAQSDEQEFADGGRITGLGALDVCWIFQEKAIRRMNYVGGPTIMDIDKLVDGVGPAEPNSLVQWGNLFFFLSEDGFYLFDGVGVTPIGTGADGGSAFDTWFLNNSNRVYWSRMSAAINPKRKLVAWLFPSASGDGTPDTILFYNWVSRRATVVPYDLQFIMGGASLGISIDELTTFNIDTATISFDDPLFLGGPYYFAGFNDSNVLGSFTGSAIAASLETGDFMFDKGRSSIEWFRPISDATSATVNGAGSLVPTDSPSFRGAVSMQPSGRCPQRQVNGNFIRAKMAVPAAATWTFATGLDFKAKREGAR